MLVVQVSPHTRRTSRITTSRDASCYASRADGDLPILRRRAADGACAAALPANAGRNCRRRARGARQNFRIEIAEDAIHIYNRDGHHVAQDALSLFPKLDVDVEKDGAQSPSNSCTELAKAEIAFRLAKRYAQDEPLDWGVAAYAPVEDETALKRPATPLIAKKKREAS